MAIQGIDHIAIRVTDLDTAIQSYKSLGFDLDKTLENPAVGKVAIFRMPNGTFIELVEPLSPDSAVGQALAKRGEGIHSLVFATDTFDETVAAIQDNGLNVIQSPDLAGNAFIHPKSTHGVLVQFQKKRS